MPGAAARLAPLAPAILASHEDARAVHAEGRKLSNFLASLVPRSAGVLLPTAAFLLPFELKTPLFRVGPVAITNVELALYAVLGIWFARRLLAGSYPIEGVRIAMLAWPTALLLSATLAPSHAAETLKFSLRCTGGALLGLAAADLLTDARTALRCAIAAAAGGCLSALTGALEVAMPRVGVILAPFRTQPSFVAGRIRASGTFEYTTIASMFWEATLVVVICLYSDGRVGATRTRRAMLLGGAALLVEAIILTRSRAALAVLAVLMPCLWVATRRSLPSLRVPILWTCVCLGVLSLVNGTDRDLRRLRFSLFDAPDWYRAEFRAEKSPARVQAGAPVGIAVTVTNTGKGAWSAAGDDAVLLGYHWFYPGGDTVAQWESPRQAIPHDIRPGESATVEVTVHPPPVAGTFELMWDLVQEPRFWFSTLRRPARGAAVEVWTPPRWRAPYSLPPPVRFEPDRGVARPILWKAALRMWLEHPLLGIGPDNFRRLYGPYAGLDSFDDRIHANNLYIEILVTSGLLGLTAWTVLSVLLGRCALSAWRSPAVEERRALLAGAAGALAAFYLHGIADYHLAFTPTYGLFFLLAGAVMAAAGARRS